MFKWGLVVYALIALLATSMEVFAVAQTRISDEPSPPLRVDSTFVWVPILVKTKNGHFVSEPDVSRFRLLDDGAPEKLTKVNTDGLPISLVVLMQTGRSANQYLSTYMNLPEFIGGMAKGSVHEVTLVTFDSRVEQIWHFPAQTDGVKYALTHQHPGDEGAAIKDAVAFGVRQLENEPGRFRRVVVLLSQAKDVGSSTPSQSLLEQLGTSSTVIYSLIFPAEKAHVQRLHEKTRTAPANEGVYRTSRALDDETAEELSLLTGGNAFQFEDQSGLDSAMVEALSDFHNEITLGFQPSRHEVGFHRIEVHIDSSKLRVIARHIYWWTPPE